MQIRRYPSCVKISISSANLIRSLHPSYTDAQLKAITPYFLQVLKTCRKFPIKSKGVSIVSDSINSWYSLSGSYSDIKALLVTLISQEISGTFL